MNKKERLVAAIEHGTVIDHIPANKTYQVASLLGLFDLKTPVTIGFNYPSQKVGSKGIIKVSDKFFTDDEISRLSVVAPNVIRTNGRSPPKFLHALPESAHHPLDACGHRATDI